MAAVQHVSLVREQSRPHVYLICGGTKLWVSSPSDFATVGFRWDKVRVVPDGTIADLPERPFIGPAPVKPSRVFFDCGTDYETPWGKYYWNCQPSASLVRHDILVAGWLVDDPWANVKPNGTGCEDVHYNIGLDAGFVRRMYGPDGLSTALVGRSYWGNPREPTTPSVAVEDKADGASIGVNYNSFILPGNDYDIHGELNAWHVNDTGDLFRAHFKGRGRAPEGWMQITVGVNQGDVREDRDAWFPFDIRAPHGEVLRRGDYVLMRGSLWQDGDHRSQSNWNVGPTRGHSGWVEIHPIDWIVRLQPRSPEQRTTVRRIALCTSPAWAEQLTDGFEIVPDFAPSGPTRRLSVATVEKLVDGRMTVPSTVVSHEVVNRGDRVHVSALVEGYGATNQGRLKAAYVVRWRETAMHDFVWIDDRVPDGAQTRADADAWTWVSSNPAPFFGLSAHQSALAAGMHQHYFTRATSVLPVGDGDVMVCAVYLDPETPPKEIMLQWNDGSWEHRAYWGANAIPWGTDGTTSRWRVGALPETGTWVRLEVPAVRVGLQNRTVSGMAFTLYDGRATWDYAGKIGAFLDAAFISQAVPRSVVVEETFGVTVTIRNTGMVKWMRGRHRLGSQNPPETMRWGRNRVELPTDLAPGGQVTFGFEVTAPVRGGTYGFQWRMLEEGAGWFGGMTPNVLVRVGGFETDPLKLPRDSA